MDSRKKEQDETEDDVTFEENYDEDTDTAIDSKRNIKKIKDKLKECQREKGEYMEGWQRAKSDLVNIRRKYEKEAQEAGEASERNFAKRILPILDSFSMAISNRKSWEELPEEWRKGMENIHNQLIKVLKEYNVLPFSPLNESFDPFFHEAVGTVEVNESHKDGLIVEVVQEGYIMEGEILRTAKVKVGEYIDKEEKDETEN